MKKLVVGAFVAVAILTWAKVPVTVMPGVVGVELPPMTYLMSDSECRSPLMFEIP